MHARIGFIVNPLAGIGGRLGFKGSDGAYAVKALMLGAELVAPKRAREFLEALQPIVEILTPPGRMGSDILAGTHHEGRYEVVECVSRRAWPTVAADTRRCAKAIESMGVDLLVFVGGDGTARDVLSSIDGRLPALGVPSGVKVFSAVFAVNPRSAARIVESFARGLRVTVEREVLDVDEEAYRRGELRVKLFGYMRVPESDLLVGSGKEVYTGVSEEEDMEAIARYFEELVEDCTLYILGPGRTVERIARRLGVEKTLLGVDAVHNGRLVGRDLDEAGILSLIEAHKGDVKIVVSPIGGQGYILGRGNQQISPEVVKRVGKEGIIVVSTPSKIARLNTLRVDTGDPRVDEMLRGPIRVITGYRMERVIRVE